MVDPPSRLDLRLMVGAFAAVAVTFFAANAYTQHAIARLDAASDGIALNATPSIQRLAAARTAVRHTEFLLGSALTIGDRRDRAAVDAALAQLNSEASAYLVLPTFPGEKDLWRGLNDAITVFNAAVQRALAQYDSGDLVAARAGLPRVSTAADRVSEACARGIEFDAQHGGELALQIKALRRDGAWVGYALNTSCVVFAVLASLLVRRQLRRYGALVEEHAALEASRATELENFAARAAHDILNPVSATQMSVNLLAKRDLGDPRARDLIDRALRNLLRIRTIIDALLQFARAGARAEAGALADVKAVVEDVASGIRPAAETSGVELRVEASPCQVRCASGILTSIVANLVHNAMKYMGDRPERRITVRALPSGALVRVEVEDTGPGIPASALDDIFLPYVRGPTHGEAGLGLGLATVKRLCEAHGGRVGVRSVPERGSVFWVELPRAPATVTPVARAARG